MDSTGNIVHYTSRNLSTSTMSNNEVYGDVDFYMIHPENVIVIIMGIISVLANGLLLYVMFKDPLKVFRTKISYLVACLGTADMLTALNGVLYGFLEPLNMYHPAIWYILWITVMVSVLIVFGMCVERWLAIVYPFKSGSIFSKTVTLYYCIGVWLLCAAVATSIHFLPLIMPFVLSCMMEALLLVMVGFYLVILRYFRKTQRQTSAVEKVTPKQERDNEVVQESAKQRPTISSKKIAIETQLFIVVSILLLILFVTFIPYNLATQISYGCLLFSKRSCPDVDDFRRYFFPFKFLNFLLNPFVYAWRLVQYRKSFALVVCNWSKTRVRTLNTSVNTATSKQTNAENRGFTERELRRVSPTNTTSGSD